MNQKQGLGLAENWSEAQLSNSCDASNRILCTQEVLSLVMFKEGQKAEAYYDDLKAKLEQEAVVMRRWPRFVFVFPVFV